MTNKSDLNNLITNNNWITEHINDASRSKKSRGYLDQDEKEYLVKWTDELIKNSEKRIARLPNDYVKEEFTERLHRQKIYIKQLLRTTGILIAFLTIGWLIFA